MDLLDHDGRLVELDVVARVGDGHDVPDGRQRGPALLADVPHLVPSIAPVSRDYDSE